MVIQKNIKTGNFEKIIDNTATGGGTETGWITVQDLIKILILKGLLTEADIK